MNTTTDNYFWPIFIACGFGLVLLVGLFFEVLAEKEWFRSLKSYQRWTKLKKWGEWLVISGVAGEVLVGGFHAYEEYRDDPRNQPIAIASAVVDLVVTENPRPIFPKRLESEKLDWGARISFIAGTNLSESNVVLSLSAGPGDVSVWNMGSDSNREWRVTFHQNQHSFSQPFTVGNEVKVKKLDDVGAIVISMPFETNVLVQSGAVVLAVNNFKWTFGVPMQRPRWDIITVKLQKERSGSVSSQVLRVPIIDFMDPPRFTNRWYDGK